MSEVNLKKLIISYNPWWNGDFTFNYIEREIYTNKLKRYMSEPQIIALTGIRRVGKTTIIYKIIKDCIARGMDPKSIFYFSFDSVKDLDLLTLLQEYELITKKSTRKDKIILCFDEIQKIDDWENKIKTIYDIQKIKENIKIYISGSESLFIKKKSKESLAGRIYEFKVSPFSFKEYLDYKEINYSDLALYETELLKAFENYILTQGFPELIGNKNTSTDIENIKIYSTNLLEKVIYSDIIQQYKIREVATLESMIKIISNEPGQIIDLAGLSNELNVSRHTVSNYMQYLIDSFLVKKVYNYFKNTRKSERKLKKYYPVIINSNILFSNDILVRSKVFETVIINQTNINFFWRDEYQNEVDGIFVGKTIIPIEVKYGNIETNGVVKFLTKFNLDKGYIISYKEEKVITKKVKVRDNKGIVKEVEKTIYVVPAYKFLLFKDKYLETDI